MELAVDGGQSGLRLGLASGGRVLLTREEPGLAYASGLTVDAVAQKVLAAWRALAPAATPGASAPPEATGASALPAASDVPVGTALAAAPDAAVGTICLGLTTLLGGPAADRELAERLFTGIGARRVLLTSDVVTAHAGAFAGRSGVVLAAGTGAIALGVAPDGRTRQVDGWGYLYGDAGSGFWIGRRGLDAAYRGFDGRATPGPLTERARHVFGDLGTAPQRLYLSPDAVAQVAGFAVHVFDLAAEDATARAIVEEAGRELAASVVAAARCFPGDEPVPVSWTGRLLRAPALRAAFEAELTARLPRALPAPPAGDGLAGAALLAATPRLGHYRTLVRTVER
ncbi:N-acetylglucosamine kinase [Streptosporangium roseum]|uniref:N-acetylglucosamine kinase n=1 Tax=Streptosporangium roseum TaxID=2001 RepID=UPI003330A97E